jgi:hypothetical protein
MISHGLGEELDFKQLTRSGDCGATSSGVDSDEDIIDNVSTDKRLCGLHGIAGVT